MATAEEDDDLAPLEYDQDRIRKLIDSGAAANEEEAMTIIDQEDEDCEDVEGEDIDEDEQGDVPGDDIDEEE